MPTEIVTEVQDRPGLLADIGQLFGKRNINITAAAAFTHDGKGYLHFVVDDADPATGLLKECGCKIITVREVLSVSLDDQPGELGRYARRLADAGVNILSFYTGGSSEGDKEVIIAVDEIAAARDI
jgi:hypothetical protein